MTNAPSLGHRFKHSAKRESWLVGSGPLHPSSSSSLGRGGSLPVAAWYAGAIQGSELLLSSWQQRGIERWSLKTRR